MAHLCHRDEPYDETDHQRFGRPKEQARNHKASGGHIGEDNPEAECLGDRGLADGRQHGHESHDGEGQEPHSASSSSPSSSVLGIRAGIRASRIASMSAAGTARAQRR